MTTLHMNELRSHLMATLASLRDREHPMEPDRARAVALVAGVMVDTARVEVDYLKATGQDRATFLEQPAGLPQLSNAPSAHNPFPVSARHRLED